MKIEINTQSALAMRLKLHLILVVFGYGLITCESDAEFEAFKKQYNKTYTKGKLGAMSESQAQKNFKENLAKVKAANADSTKTYKSGIHEDSDMSDDEIDKYKKGFKEEKPTKENSSKLKTSHLKSSNGNAIDTSELKLEAPYDGKAMLHASNAASLDLRSNVSPVNFVNFLQHFLVICGPWIIG